MRREEEEKSRGAERKEERGEVRGEEAGADPGGVRWVRTNPPYY